MYCDLRNTLPDGRARVPLEFSRVTDYAVFRREPHPSIGRITTPIRLFQLECQQHLASRSPRKAWELMASTGGVPAGIATIFVGERYAGLFDVAVLEPLRNQGIGTSLVRYASSFAQQHGAEGIVLIASNAGYGVYERAGFEEVARFGFWYAARP